VPYTTNHASNELIGMVEAGRVSSMQLMKAIPQRKVLLIALRELWRCPSDIIHCDLLIWNIVAAD
jgi:hypothetical protein